MALSVDVTDGPGIDDAIAIVRDNLGPVTLLVNNAGMAGPIGQLWQFTTFQPGSDQLIRRQKITESQLGLNSNTARCRDKRDRTVGGKSLSDRPTNSFVYKTSAPYPSS